MRGRPRRVQGLIHLSGMIDYACPLGYMKRGEKKTGNKIIKDKEYLKKLKHLLLVTTLIEVMFLFSGTNKIKDSRLEKPFFYFSMSKTLSGKQKRKSKFGKLSDGNKISRVETITKNCSRGQTFTTKLKHVGICSTCSSGVIKLQQIAPH